MSKFIAGIPLTTEKKYVDRGLIVPNRPESSVHNCPIDQSWGIREFYVNDPSGNTFRFWKIIGDNFFQQKRMTKSMADELMILNKKIVKTE